MSPILACTDGSLYAPSVYQSAAWAASRMGATIQVLHVVERTEMIGSPPTTGRISQLPCSDLFDEVGQLDRAQAEIASQRGEELLQNAGNFLSATGNFEVNTIQRHGALEEILEELETDASLVILGKRGEQTDFESGHLGAHLGQVIRRVRVPVWVAAREFRPVQRFLVAFDGGNSAAKAIRHIASSPLLRGLDCHLVSVAGPASPLARQLAAAAMKLRRAGFQVTADVIEGKDPAEVIATEARVREVDLLVMGAYGRSRVRQLIMGSTTTALIRGCLLPQLLFR